MFTKFVLYNYTNAIYSKIFLCNRKTLFILSVNMRNFTLLRIYPNEFLLLETKESASKVHPSHKFQTVDTSCSRHFLQFHGHLQGRSKEYQGKKLVGYSAEEMFHVVADVGKYENFLPFCKRSHVTFKSSDNIKAELVIGFPPLVESYVSNVTLVKPQLIKAVCTEGKLFNYLLTIWKFSSGLKNNERSCIIDFFVSFEFRSALHSHLANLFFNELVRQMENAFYQEARHRIEEFLVYGSNPFTRDKYLQVTPVKYYACTVLLSVGLPCAVGSYKKCLGFVVTEMCDLPASLTDEAGINNNDVFYFGKGIRR